MRTVLLAGSFKTMAFPHRDTAIYQYLVRIMYDLIHDGIGDCTVTFRTAEFGLRREYQSSGSYCEQKIIDPATQRASMISRRSYDSYGVKGPVNHSSRMRRCKRQIVSTFSKSSYVR